MEKEFTELLYANQGMVHKICYLYFGNRSMKEDYKQELIIQLWRAFPSFNHQSKFSTWMYRVCLNAAIDILRKEKTQPAMVNIEIPDMAENKNELSPVHEKLYQAIGNLSAIDKALITLYLEDFSYKEIAEILGISENNTGVKISRIKTEIIKTIKYGD